MSPFSLQNITPGAVVKILTEITTNPEDMSHWMQRASDSCGQVDTVQHVEQCIEDVCQKNGMTMKETLKSKPDGSRNATLGFLGFFLSGSHNSPRTSGYSKAINTKVVEKFKNDLCQDPPSNGLKSLVPELEPMTIPEPAMARTMLPGVAVFLGILAVRAYQFATGSFFLFAAPENTTSRYGGA